MPARNNKPQQGKLESFGSFGQPHSVEMSFEMIDAQQGQVPARFSMIRLVGGVTEIPPPTTRVATTENRRVESWLSCRVTVSTANLFTRPVGVFPTLS